MPDLLALWGAVALRDLAAPLALWTLVALAAETLFRLTRADAALSLPVRSALVAALPLALLAAPAARFLAPDAVPSVPFAPSAEIWLPAVVVGDAPGAPLAQRLAGAALLLAVGVGVVAVLRLASSLVRLRRLAWADAPSAVRDRALAALRAAGVTRPVRVVTGADVPLTFGARRPVIAVPADLDGEALDLALAHEAAHVRAGDFARQTLLSALAAPFAAHPLVGLLVRGAALDRERLADAAVLDRRPDARKRYGHLLASFAGMPAPRLTLGASQSSLLHRLTAMTRLPSPARRRAFGLAGRVAALAVIVGLTTAGAVSSARADASPVPAVSEPAAPVVALRPPTAPSHEVAPAEEVIAPEAAAPSEAEPVPAVEAAQIVPPSVTPDTVYTTVDEMPEMVGGVEAFAARLVYPDDARAEAASGLTVVKFVVEATGAVTRVEVVRSSGSAALDAAAVAAVAAQPFTPGRLDGEAVAVSLVLPVRFALHDGAPAER